MGSIFATGEWVTASARGFQFTIAEPRPILNVPTGHSTVPGKAAEADDGKFIPSHSTLGGIE